MYTNWKHDSKRALKRLKKPAKRFWDAFKTLNPFKAFWPLAGLAFIGVALVTIYYLLKSKHTISRNEGSVLLGLYILFVLSQVGTFLF
jgi:hypothetical protein